MLAVLLESEGYDVQTARNGVEALSSLSQTRPAVILLDLMMPVMSGDEFRERQLADPRYRDVPVICMSAAHDGRERCERMHANLYFQKPVDFDRLLGAVRATCDGDVTAEGPLTNHDSRLTSVPPGSAAVTPSTARRRARAVRAACRGARRSRRRTPSARSADRCTR